MLTHPVLVPEQVGAEVILIPGNREVWAVKEEMYERRQQNFLCEVGEILFSREEHTSSLSNTKWSALQTYIQETYCIYYYIEWYIYLIFRNVYVYAYVCKQQLMKKDINLKESKVYMGIFERKGVMM